MTDPASLRTLVAGATAPAEWPAEAIRKDASVGKLLARWQSLLERRGGPGAFERRLERLGLDRHAASSWLASRSLPSEADIPDWGRLLGDVLSPQAFQHPDPCVPELAFPTEAERALPHRDPARTPQFPEFLHPFVTVYLRRLERTVADLWLLLAPPVRAQLGRGLLARLSHLAARTVAHEVKRAGRAGELRGGDAASRYRSLVSGRWGQPDGLTSLLGRYPVLGRLLATTTMQAIDCTVELLRRWRRDRQRIARVLRLREPVRRIESLLHGLSDPHDGGRTVCLLELEGGDRIIYKPRDLRAESAYGRLIAWLGARGDLLDLRAARVLCGRGYGWCEYVGATPCFNSEMVARYYQRQGMHLALFYFLCGVDFNWENFVACGEHPVPVDLEGLFSPGLRTLPESAGDLPVALHPVWFSVWSTLMLPTWREGGSGGPVDVFSGINGSGARKPVARRPVWKNIGTDRLTLCFNDVAVSSTASLPKWQGTPVPVDDFVEEVVNGFEKLVRAVLDRRDALLAAGGPFARFTHVQARLLLRETEEYERILFWASAPDQLTSGAAHDIALDIICASVPSSLDGTPQPMVTEAEKHALWARDVPLFRASASALHVVAPGGASFGPISQYCAREHVLRRLRGASPAAMRWQREIIRATFEMARWTSASPSADADSPELASSASRASRVEDRLLEHAVMFGEQLSRLAVDPGSGASWLSLVLHLGPPPRFELTHPAPWATAGAAGTGLFLANLAAATGETRFERLASEALIYAASTTGDMIAAGHGGALCALGLNGLGLVVYALSSAAELLREPAIARRAIALVEAVDGEHWSHLANPEVLNGAAGSLLALLCVQRRAPEALAMDCAVALAEGVLACRNEQGFKVPGFERPLLGMAHGSSGIALALSRLHSCTGDFRYLEGARHALDHERAHYAVVPGDWPNLQCQPGAQEFMTGWCAGAPGIGLARLELMHLLGDQRCDEEVDAAVVATRRHLGSAPDNLCCGEGARLVFLARAAHDRGDASLREEALDSAETMLHGQAQRGYLRLGGIRSGPIVPGLFHGIAGIGMALLTVRDPAATSDVLRVA